jgi:hypothetical protein
MSRPSEPSGRDESPPGDFGIASRRSVLLMAAAAVLSAGVVGTSTRAFGAEPSNLTLPSLPESTSTSSGEAFALRAAADYPNGQIPLSELDFVGVSTLGLGNQYLLSSAALALADLKEAFQDALGTSLTLAEGYRDLARQQYLWDGYQAGKPGFNLAAEPGKSIHGFGRAVDFSGGVASYGTTQKNWMNAHGPAFGWQPRGDGFGQPEPWHFEYDGSYQPDQPTPPADNAQEEADMKLITNSGRVWLLGEFTAVEIDADFLADLKAAHNVPGTLSDLRAALAKQYGDPIAIQSGGNVSGLIAVAQSNRSGLIKSIKS